MRHIALFAAIALVLCLLWAQARDSRWSGHLCVDPVVYQDRAVSFLEHGSWHEAGTNEYQPGALWFFVAVAGLSGAPHDFDAFLSALLAVNLLIIAAHAALASACGPRGAPWLMLFFAAACGPILLYRFEPFVSLLVLGAWALWRRGLTALAAALLGVATATKVYPAFLLPLLLAWAWSDGGWKKAASASASWFIAGMLVLAFYLGTGGTCDDLVSSLRFHSDKPFGIDGPLGTLIPLAQRLAGIPLRMAPRNGIYGFEPDLGSVGNFLATWAALVFVVAAIAVLVRFRSVKALVEPGAIFVVLGLLVGAGKLMAPQYLWWAVPFFALASPGWFARRERAAVCLLITLCLLLSQSVYPLRYSDFIACFDGQYSSSPVFWLNAVKNMLWLGAVVVALVPFARSPETARAQATPVSP